MTMRGFVARLHPDASTTERLHQWMGARRFLWKRLIDLEKADTGAASRPGVLVFCSTRSASGSLAPTLSPADSQGRRDHGRDAQYEGHGDGLLHVIRGFRPVSSAASAARCTRKAQSFGAGAAL